MSKGGQSLMEFPVSNVEGIALMGNVQVTAQALHFLLQQGIDISHYTYGGHYLGRTAAESSKNIFLRFSQYELYNDKEKKAEFCQKYCGQQNRKSAQCNTELQVGRLSC